MTKYMEKIFPGDTEEDISQIRRSLILCLSALNGLCDVVESLSDRMDTLDKEAVK